MAAVLEGVVDAQLGSEAEPDVAVEAEIWAVRPAVNTSHRRRVVRAAGRITQMQMPAQ